MQSGSESGVIVKWRTDVPTDSVVRYGFDPGHLTLSELNAGARAEHEVRLAGLAADTTYYYSVGTSAFVLAGADSNHFVNTSPPRGVSKPTRTWVAGDSGTADANARAVRDAFSISWGRAIPTSG